MTRHGKNCTAGAVYTYHEKKKDTGTVGDLSHLWFPLCCPILPLNALSLPCVY